MRRTKKLLIVGLVLAMGIVLALPFRKSTSQYSAKDQLTKQRIATEQQTAISAGGTQRHNLANRHVTAKMTSTGDRQRVSASGTPTTSFDLANHPAFAGKTASLAEQPVTPRRHQPDRHKTVYPPTEKGIKPAYRTIERPEQPDSRWPREVVHIVQDGDTLEILAERYLGDAARALEIFDKNRDKLANPHQLPIGAELRVPVAPGRMLD